MLLKIYVAEFIQLDISPNIYAKQTRAEIVHHGHLDTIIEMKIRYFEAQNEVNEITNDIVIFDSWSISLEERVDTCRSRHKYRFMKQDESNVLM